MGNGNSNWNGTGGSRFRMSCLVGEPLAGRASDRNSFALHVVDAEFGAMVHTKIELGQVFIKILGVHMLVHADNAAFEDRKEPFQRIGVYVAAPPFELGMVNRAVAGGAREFEHRGTIGHKAALGVELAVEQAADATMVDHHGSDRAAALDKAKNLDVRLAAARPLTRLDRAAHFHIVGLDRLAFAANRPALVGVHHFANAVAQVPCRFEAATEHSLKLPGGNAFLRSAKQVDGLQPRPQRQMAILENRTLAHRKDRAAAGVALAQPDLNNAFGVLLAGLGTDGKPADLLGGRAAMRADRTVRPQLGFDVLKSGFFIEKPRIGKDGLGHGYLQ